MNLFKLVIKSGATNQFGNPTIEAQARNEGYDKISTASQSDTSDEAVIAKSRILRDGKAKYNGKTYEVIEDRD